MCGHCVQRDRNDHKALFVVCVRWLFSLYLCLFDLVVPTDRESIFHFSPLDVMTHFDKNTFLEIVGIPFHELVGYGGTAIYATFMLPQIHKTWKTKSTNDISVYMLWFHVLGLMCMFYYGYNVGSIQIVASNVMCIMQTLILLYMVHAYSHKRNLYATHL